MTRKRALKRVKKPAGDPVGEHHFGLDSRGSWHGADSVKELTKIVSDIEKDRTIRYLESQNRELLRMLTLAYGTIVNVQSSGCTLIAKKLEPFVFPPPTDRDVYAQEVMRTLEGAAGAQIGVVKAC